MDKIKINEHKNNYMKIEVNDNEYLISYNTTIAVKMKTGKIILDKNNYACSKMTSKHRNAFLNETTKETEKKIASKEYELIDLNDGFRY
jgi:hypothetical protein